VYTEHPIVKRFSAENCPVKSGPKNGGFSGIRGLNVKFLFSSPEPRGTTSFDLFCVKIGSGAWPVGRFWKNPEKRSRVNIFDEQFRAYGEKKSLEGS